jgi:hypothetical protein
MPTPSLIQRGSITIAAAASSVNVVRGTSDGFDTTITPSLTMLFFSTRHGTDGSGEVSKMVRGRVIDGDTLTFDRGGTAGTVTVEWQLVSFASGIVVQHRAATVAVDTTEITASIDAPSLGGARFIIPGGVAPSASTGTTRMAVRWDLQDSTTARARVNSTSASITVACACQVVEYPDAVVRVAEYATTTGTGTTLDIAISSVDTSKCVVFGSASVSGDTNAGTAYGFSLPDSTTLRLTRGAANNLTLNATCYVVQLPDASIAPYAATHTATGTVNTTITAVTLARAAVVNGNLLNGWSVGRGTEVNLSRITATQKFTTTTNVETIKGSATGNVDYDLQVVEWAEVAVGPTITVQPVAQQVREGTTATFTVAATGTGTLAYAWTKNGTAIGTDSATLAFTAALGDNTASIVCEVTDDNGTTATTPATLTVTPAPRVLLSFRPPA